MTGRRFAIGLFLALLAIQVFLSRRIDRTNPIPEYDEAVYADLAREIVRTGKPLRRLGEEPRFYYIHPYLQTSLWSLSIAGSVDSEAVEPPSKALSHLTKMRWATTLFALGAATLLFVTALSRFGPAIAAVASALLVLNPMWLRYGHLVYLEVPVAFWILCSLAAWEKCSPETHFPGKPKPWLTASGLFAGAAAVTKYTSLVWGMTALLLLSLGLYRKRIRTGEAAFWILGAVAATSTWPLYILWKGSFSDWISGSLARWTSFQGGQGGDPRTDWGILDLYAATFREIGIVHTALLGAGLLLVLYLARRPVRSAEQSRVLRGRQHWADRLFWCAQRTLRFPEPLSRRSCTPARNLSGVEEDRSVPTPSILPHLLYSCVFLVVWSLSPTKDPKFIVVALPSICLIAAAGLVAVCRETGISRLPCPILVPPIVALMIVAFPIDLLGLDATPLKKIYPTDHAYTRTCLPHGADYLPIAESLSKTTAPGDLLTVGRQGPIPGYLADRPYALLYTYRYRTTLDALLEETDYVLIDDVWENCLAGLEGEGVQVIRGTIEKDFEILEESGRVRLFQRLN